MSVGISRADRGKIAVNDKLQTSVPNIYAIGDVTDIKQLAHFASAQGKAIGEACTLTDFCSQGSLCSGKCLPLCGGPSDQSCATGHCTALKDGDRVFAYTCQ